MVRRAIHAGVLLLLSTTSARGDVTGRADEAYGAALQSCTDARIACSTFVFRGLVVPSAAAVQPPTLTIPDAYVVEVSRDGIEDSDPAVVGRVALSIPVAACRLDEEILAAGRLSIVLSQTGTNWSKYAMESRQQAAERYPMTFPILNDPRSGLQYQELESYANWHARRRYLNDAPQDVGFVFMECTHAAAGREPDAIVGKCWLRTTSVDGLLTATVFRESRLEDWAEVHRCVDDLVQGSRANRPRPFQVVSGRSEGRPVGWLLMSASDPKRTWRTEVSGKKHGWIPAAAALLGLLISAGCEGPPLPSQGVMRVAIVSVFIEQGTCSSLLECDRKELVFSQTDGKTVYFSVYDASDPGLRARITRVVEKVRAEEEIADPVEIAFRDESKAESLAKRLPSWADHTVEID